MKLSPFCSALAVLALAGAASHGKPFGVTVPDGPSSKARMSLPAGGTLEVRLVSNPSTGYSWTASVGGASVLKPVGESKYVPLPKPLPGAPGTQVFTYKAEKPGTVEITYRYARSWEKGVAPVKTAKVTVTVTKPGGPAGGR
jgi:inhibitor of cysteine peptidase